MADQDPRQAGRQRGLGVVHPERQAGLMEGPAEEPFVEPGPALRGGLLGGDEAAQRAHEHPAEERRPAARPIIEVLTGRLERRCVAR